MKSDQAPPEAVSVVGDELQAAVAEVAESRGVRLFHEDARRRLFYLPSARFRTEWRIVS